MLESLEGKRGQVRAKPPLPALEGLFGLPTVVNNVISFGTVPWILAHGGEAYAALGTGRSRGTSVFQLAGNVARGGIVETAFGVTLGDLVEDFGGGTRTGRPIRAVQVGGPLGAYLPVDKLDLPMDYEAFAAEGAMVGHGGLVVFDDTVDMAGMARFAMEFCAAESCGKCTPCRIGAVRGVETIDRIREGTGDEKRKNLVLLEDLCELMTDGSLCALGGLTPMPVRSAVQALPRGLRPGGDGVTLLRETDYGTPEAARSGERRADGRRRPGRGARGHLGDARRDGGRHRRAQAVRHRLARGVRLVPAVRGRDRRHARHARLVHDAGRGRDGGPHADAARREAPARGHGAVHLGPPAGLPDLLRERRLRAPGHGRRSPACARSATARASRPARTTWTRRPTPRTRTSRSRRASASPARAACARATRSRGRSR